MRQAQAKRTIIQFMATYFLFQMFISGPSSYLPLFLQDRGLSDAQIGIVLGVSPFVSMAGQFIWAGVADRVGSVNRIFFQLSVVSLLIVPLHLLFGGFYYMFFILCIFDFFYSALAPLLDSLGIYYAQAQKFNFGNFRLMGSLGFLVAALISGFLADLKIDYIYYFQVAMGVLFLVCIPLLPKVQMPKMKKAVFNPVVLLRKPSALMVLLVVAPIMFGFGYSLSFYPTYLVGQLGAPSSYIGNGNIVSITIEVTFLFYMDNLVDRVPIKLLLAGISFLTIVRWTVYGLSDSILLVLLFFGIQGITSVATYFFASFYFKRIAPPEGKVSTQTLVSIYCYGICRGLGALLGAPLTQLVGGTRNAFLAIAGITLAALVLFMLIPVKFAQQEQADSGVQIGDEGR